MTNTWENPDNNPLGTTADPTDPLASAGIRHTDRPHRLYRALAWVGIAAGSLFIVATVFFSGYYLGSHGGGGHHGQHRAMLLKPFPGPDHRMGPGGRMGSDDGPRRTPLTQPSPSGSPERP
ncbi:MAG: hypothetical protein ACKOB8_15240 [Mycobacterium sp.]